MAQQLTVKVPGPCCAIFAWGATIIGALLQQSSASPSRGNYALVSSGIRSFLPADEEALTKTLFQKRQAVFPAKDGALFRAARRAHRHSLSGQAKALLRRRRGWFYAIAGLTLLAAVYSGWLLPASLAVRLGLMGFALWAAVLAWVALRTWVLLPEIGRAHV